MEDGMARKLFFPEPIEVYLCDRWADTDWLAIMEGGHMLGIWENDHLLRVAREWPAFMRGVKMFYHSPNGVDWHYYLDAQDVHQ
jgi:hypothetical protein